VVELQRLHRDITDLLVATAIAAGQLDGIVGLAAGSVAADPLAEPAVRLLMRALAASGRAPEALDVARDYRHRLAEETGLDPTPALAALEQAVAGGELNAPTDPGTTAVGPPTPRPATPLVGRESQVAAVRRLLGTERLVTVTGPGGVGKTRLALEVAHHEGTDAILLLAPVTDPGAVPHALAAALRLTVVHGDVLAACVAVLATGPHLLLIDNCEHVLDAVRDTVATLLDGCPALIVLATSREPLGLAGECPSRLAPLALTAADEGPGPAVALFVDRAARVRPGFTGDGDDRGLVATIVRALDGMPLAIELAAGRLSTFSLADLAARLDRSLDLLGAGRRTAEHRHRTLRATVRWSYDLLPDDERRLFRHLAVFVDGVDLATAEDVARDLGLAVDPGSALAHLVDASMIEVRFGGRTRYRMLETLRAFGLDRLADAGEDAAASARLLRWARHLAGWIDGISVTAREPDADAALRRELPNLRAAWRLARSQDTLDAAVALVVGVHDCAEWRDLTEIWGWAVELAEDPAISEHGQAARVRGAAAMALYTQGDYARAERMARHGQAASAEPAEEWSCRHALALAAMSSGDFAGVIEHTAAAARAARRPTIDNGLAALASVYAGDLDRATGFHDRMAAVAVSPTMRGFAAYVAGEIDNAAGRPDEAEQSYTSALELARTSGATFLVGITSVGLVTARAAAGRVGDALAGYREVIDYWEAAGNWTHQWVTLRNLAGLLVALGDPEPAALLRAAADQAPDAPPDPAADDPPAGPLDRTRALAVARAAIARHLAVTAGPRVPDAAGRAGRSGHPG
jgi:predicted ATPase